MRWSLLLLLVCSLPLGAAEPIDYSRAVKPIFKARCYACHGALKQKAKLRLDSGPLIVKGSRSGPIVAPGKAARSLLIERVTDSQASSRMPPEGKPLSAEQIALLKAWIDQGARFPAADQPEEEPQRHWAFQKPIRPPVPRVQNAAWVRNPIDAFVLARLEATHLQPSAAADRAVLLRRVYLDLIGLPPTRAELHAFLADAAPDAYEKVVDRLLASPQYGERWGRHWMDVWRYSDWYGRRVVPDVLNSYPMIWRWRDWIVRSLNEDKGYDRMIVDMLAADEVAPEDDANLVATGFVVRNWFKWNYNSWMKDQVEHTGKAFLGLTLNCCQCHDHKYDPITQEEYFKFRAFFEPLELRHDRVPGEPDPGPFRKYVYVESYGPIHSGMVRIFDEKVDAKTYLYLRGDERNVVPGKPPIPAGVPAILGGTLKIEPVRLPPRAYYPGLKLFVQEEETARRVQAVTAARLGLQAAHARLGAAQQPLLQGPPTATTQAAIAAARAVLALAEAHLASAEADHRALLARIAADNVRHQLAAGNATPLAQAASKAERLANLCLAQEKVLQAEQALTAATQTAKPAIAPAQQQLAAARNALAVAQKARDAASTQYTPLTPVYPSTSTGRRRALATWIANRDNPLTARVAVNHLWGWHFGRPLVETTYNFGRSGKRPSHPQLLDWLAVEFMDKGWNMKHLHRLLVTSNAYRMTSHRSPSSPELARDPENRLLWHFSPARMEAEVVRDSILCVAGELDQKLGGHEIDHALGLQVRRRSLYFAHHGESKMEFLELFDGANPCDGYLRTASIMPQQALALSNSELTLRQSRLLARKLWRQVEALGGSEAAFVEAAFEQVLTRSPSAQEKSLTLAFLARQRRLFAQNGPPSAGAVPGGVAAAADPALRARENLVEALFNHNDFVTIR